MRGWVSASGGHPSPRTPFKRKETDLHFKEAASRMTGFSTPIFGVSWEPAVSDVAVARRLLAFLEDRRVLYSPTHVEIADHCIRSVLEIRHHLTETIGEAGIADDLDGHIRAMRGACRRFLTELDVDDGDDRLWIPGSRRDQYRSGLDDWRLNQALGELRAVFGIHIGHVASKYGIDIEDDLASILPPPAEIQ